jgi:hypothetical protein
MALPFLFALKYTLGLHLPIRREPFEFRQQFGNLGLEPGVVPLRLARLR